MNSQFDPNNNIVKLCLRGMGMEDTNKPEEAGILFLEAFYVARHQKNTSDRLKWLETSLQFALKVNDVATTSAFPTLYSKIAACYEALGDPEKTKENEELSNSYKLPPADKGPFFHGTKADLQVGDLLTAKGDSNYKPDLKMNHIYFTALINGAGLAASLAKGDGQERVYIVEPT